MTVIVTGAGGAGCGRAIAARFAREGAAVVVSDIADTGGHETVGLINVTAAAPPTIAPTFATSARSRS